MTAMQIYQVRITCNACGMEVRQSAPTREGLNVEKYRVSLQRAGWAYLKETGADFCPRCVAAQNGEVKS